MNAISGCKACAKYCQEAFSSDMSTAPANAVEEWREELAQFHKTSLSMKDSGYCAPCAHYIGFIGPFISELLTKREEEVIERIKDMIKLRAWETPYLRGKRIDLEIVGVVHNNVIESIEELLDSLKGD